MSTLGVMLDATYALYGMEMNFVHTPVAGKSNCSLVKWTENSLTRICWYASDADRIEFSTRIHLPEDLQLDDYERFVELLNSVTPADSEPGVFARSARLERRDLIVESTVAIADASYADEVEQAYGAALQEVMSIEAAIS